MACTSGIYDRVVVATYTGDVTPADVMTVLAGALTARAKVGRPLLYIGFSPEDVPAPRDSVRTACHELAKQVYALCDYVALVVPGRGVDKRLQRASAASMLGNRGRGANVEIHESFDVIARRCSSVVQKECERALTIARARGVLPAVTSVPFWASSSAMASSAVE